MRACLRLQSARDRSRQLFFNELHRQLHETIVRDLPLRTHGDAQKRYDRLVDSILLHAGSDACLFGTKGYSPKHITV